MKILVINAGSSSLKYQLIDMEGEQVLAKGLCERIGIDGHYHPQGTATKSGEKDVADAGLIPRHLSRSSRLLTAGEGKVIGDLSEVSAIGHRVVQRRLKIRPLGAH